jgi:hypothetical protein
MKFFWQQLSPGEKEALLRHVLLKQQRVQGPVTAEKVCAALQKTHSLSCFTQPEGKVHFRFEMTAKTVRSGARSGVSLSDEFADGIYKAALRAKGVQVEDGFRAARNRGKSPRLAQA